MPILASHPLAINFLGQRWGLNSKGRRTAIQAHDMNAAEALYNKNIGLIQLLGADKMGKPIMETPIFNTEVTKESHWPTVLLVNVPIMSVEPAKGSISVDNL